MFFFSFGHCAVCPDLITPFVSLTFVEIVLNIHEIFAAGHEAANHQSIYRNIYLYIYKRLKCSTTT